MRFKTKIKFEAMELLYRGKKFYRELSYKKGKKLMKGSDVQEVQKVLNKKGYKCKIDSMYGIETQEAVRKFQYDNCIKVDGIVGEITWNMLFN
ncbi:peptidoglycan-binding domain-containing protein [Oceanirhabdus sp. W0125-5]|uniref:peptidoglycan-binding domain-containing protein n=1 Tax=Oceanirhabdus sp. W0125-5 TaxID=2999116 RepID=UPI0022F2F0F3|nr:peptidoglycan-binding domain-containing protein [Oceanirhabdus sp. W0125-5]WBW94747.1 peptidoglycan-binding domain-containing protein [Oceanirhabdus sp. W0125-5]